MSLQKQLWASRFPKPCISLQLPWHPVLWDTKQVWHWMKLLIKQWALAFSLYRTRILKCCCLTRVTVPSLTTLSFVRLFKPYNDSMPNSAFSPDLLFTEKSTLSADYNHLVSFLLRGPKFLCTAEGVRFYHSRNVLGSCCTLWELAQDINCPWGFNLLSFHHNMDYIFNSFPHMLILHKIVSFHFIFPCHLLFFNFLKIPYIS